MTTRKPPPNTRRAGAKWFKASRQFREECHRRGDRCWRCGGEIDWDAPAGTSQAFETDHSIPVNGPGGRPDLMSAALTVARFPQNM